VTSSNACANFLRTQTPLKDDVYIIYGGDLVLIAFFGLGFTFTLIVAPLQICMNCLRNKGI
jgi:hypothetical protein